MYKYSSNKMVMTIWSTPLESSTPLKHIAKCTLGKISQQLYTNTPKYNKQVTKHHIKISASIDACPDRSSQGKVAEIFNSGSKKCCFS